ncbi:P-loop NTPase [Belnapia rosea]|uniref:P-loop NTPase n=1 Tax=Belnapia rosea TaxID=938405 RepID=UPI0015A24505|nr:SIR2 family protein [Belnapia rosea]
MAELLAVKVGLSYAEDELPEVISAVVGPRLSHAQFIQVLRDEYTRVSPSAELQRLLNYTWHRIYTWNIDDALSNTAHAVQRRRYFNGLADKVSAREGHEYLQIVHLHGESQKPEHGFIFSQADYNARLNRNEHDWYRELAADCVLHTPVFIGSRLNEPILSAELDRARPPSAPGLGLAFLVTPDTFTEVQLSSFNTRNICVIQATLEDFVAWLEAKIGGAITPIDVLRENNAFGAKLVSNTTVSAADLDAAKYIVLRDWRSAQGEGDKLGGSTRRREARSFLEGTAPTWRLVSTNIPVWLQRTESLLRAMTDAIRDRERCFVCHGQAGSGKTTALMQCLLRFSRENEGSIIYELRSDIRSLRAALQLISRLHKTEHVVLYIRDAFIFGDSFAEDVLGIDPGRITIVTSARSGEWRDHIERRIETFTKTFVYERFGPNDFEPLVERLVDYVPAPDFLKLSQPEKLEKLRSSKSQLLIALRETTASERFSDVITKEFLGLPDDDCRYLAIIVGLSTLARSGIKESEAKAAYERIFTKRNFEQCLLALEGIVSKDSGGRLWARHELYVRHIIENVCDINVIIASIIEVLRTYTKYKIPVVKSVSRLDSLLFKFLLNHNFTSELARRRHAKEEGRAIYEEFEVEFQLDGHFWLQYGQYLVSIGRDEEALSILNKSIRAYSDNPYAVHAYADLQLKVAAKRPYYDSVTEKLIGDAVKTLEGQLAYAALDWDQYPIVTLSEKYVGAMIKHNKNEKAKELATQYYRELEKIVRFNAAKPLQVARERLLHYISTGRWYQGSLPKFEENPKAQPRVGSRAKRGQRTN